MYMHISCQFSSFREQTELTQVSALRNRRADTSYGNFKTVISAAGAQEANLPPVTR